MRAALTGRVARLRAAVPAGCGACRSWPKVHFLREGEPEPPTACDACGRVWHGLTRVYLLVRVEQEDAPNG